jgi:succinyl-CoA synthetase beta subunit
MEAIKLLESDPNINAIVLNIFGGIMSCDKIAASIIRAADEVQTTKPIVLRLKGNNSESAKKMIEGKEGSLGIYYCE